MKVDVVEASCTPVTVIRNSGRAHAIRPGSALRRGQEEPWTRPCIQGAKVVIIGDSQVKVNNFYCLSVTFSVKKNCLLPSRGGFFALGPSD